MSVTKTDLVELLHLSRLIGSLFIARTLTTAAAALAPDLDEPLRQASNKLYSLLDQLGFDRVEILARLNERADQEREAFERLACKTNIH